MIVRKSCSSEQCIISLWPECEQDVLYGTSIVDEGLVRSSTYKWRRRRRKKASLLLTGQLLWLAITCLVPVVVANRLNLLESSRLPGGSRLSYVGKDKVPEVDRPDGPLGIHIRNYRLLPNTLSPTIAPIFDYTPEPSANAEVTDKPTPAVTALPTPAPTEDTPSPTLAVATEMPQSIVTRAPTLQPSADRGEVTPTPRAVGATTPGPTMATTQPQTEKPVLVAPTPTPTHATAAPTHKPSSTQKPTSKPSMAPVTAVPQPTVRPTIVTTLPGTEDPVVTPSPSVTPPTTLKPTVAIVTLKPTLEPVTSEPTQAATLSIVPTPAPGIIIVETDLPTVLPTFGGGGGTVLPTQGPTDVVTGAPSTIPTTLVPSIAPTPAFTTQQPTTVEVTASPTVQVTTQPTPIGTNIVITVPPTIVTLQPTTGAPSNAPTSIATQVATTLQPTDVEVTPAPSVVTSSPSPNPVSGSTESPTDTDEGHDTPAPTSVSPTSAPVAVPTSAPTSTPAPTPSDTTPSPTVAAFPSWSLLEQSLKSATDVSAALVYNPGTDSVVTATSGTSSSAIVSLQAVTGEQDWAAPLSGSSQVVTTSSVSVNPLTGALVLAGCVEGQWLADASAGGADVVVWQTSPTTGKFERGWQGGTVGDDCLWALAIDVSSGDFFVGGGTTGDVTSPEKTPTGYPRPFVMRLYDSADKGDSMADAVEWAYQLTTDGVVSGIATAILGDWMQPVVFAVGSCAQNVTTPPRSLGMNSTEPSNAFAIALNGTTGAKLWEISEVGSYTAVAADTAGDIFIVGCNGMGNVIVSKRIGWCGEEVWRYTSTASVQGCAFAVTVDNSGNPTVAGGIASSDGYDAFTLTLSAAQGDVLCDYRMGGGGDDAILGLAVVPHNPLVMLVTGVATTDFLSSAPGTAPTTTTMPMKDMKGSSNDYIACSFWLSLDLSDSNVCGLTLEALSSGSNLMIELPVESWVGTAIACVLAGSVFVAVGLVLLSSCVGMKSRRRLRGPAFPMCFLLVRQLQFLGALDPINLISAPDSFKTCVNTLRWANLQFSVPHSSLPAGTCEFSEHTESALLTFIGNAILIYGGVMMLGVFHVIIVSVLEARWLSKQASSSKISGPSTAEMLSGPTSTSILTNEHTTPAKLRDIVHTVIHTSSGSRRNFSESSASSWNYSPNSDDVCNKSYSHTDKDYSSSVSSCVESPAIGPLHRLNSLQESPLRRAQSLTCSPWAYPPYTEICFFVLSVTGAAASQAQIASQLWKNSVKEDCEVGMSVVVCIAMLLGPLGMLIMWVNCVGVQCSGRRRILEYRFVSRHVKRDGSTRPLNQWLAESWTNSCITGCSVFASCDRGRWMVRDQSYRTRTISLILEPLYAGYTGSGTLYGIFVVCMSIAIGAMPAAISRPTTALLSLVLLFSVDFISLCLGKPYLNSITNTCACVMSCSASIACGLILVAEKGSAGLTSGLYGFVLLSQLLVVVTCSVGVAVDAVASLQFSRRPARKLKGRDALEQHHPHFEQETKSSLKYVLPLVLANTYEMVTGIGRCLVRTAPAAATISPKETPVDMQDDTDVLDFREEKDSSSGSGLDKSHRSRRSLYDDVRGGVGGMDVTADVTDRRTDVPMERRSSGNSTNHRRKRSLSADARPEGNKSFTGTRGLVDARMSPLALNSSPEGWSSVPGLFHKVTVTDLPLRRGSTGALQNNPQMHMRTSLFTSEDHARHQHQSSGSNQSSFASTPVNLPPPTGARTRVGSADGILIHSSRTYMHREDSPTSHLPPTGLHNPYPPPSRGAGSFLPTSSSTNTPSSRRHIDSSMSRQRPPALVLHGSPYLPPLSRAHISQRNSEIPLAVAAAAAGFSPHLSSTSSRSSRNKRPEL